MIYIKKISLSPPLHTYIHTYIYMNIPTTSLSKQSHQLSIKLSNLCVCVCVFSKLVMEKQICAQNIAPSSLSMHKNSKTITKTKPKIRIIHIFAPEIIKTDAANFRELVQRLTGKPTNEVEDCIKKKPRNKKETRIFSSNKKMVMAVRAGFHATSEGFRERIKGEDEIWRDANTGGGFLGGFQEFDNGFMQEINQFPSMEGINQVDVYAESQAA